MSNVRVHIWKVELLTADCDPWDEYDFEEVPEGTPDDEVLSDTGVIVEMTHGRLDTMRRLAERARVLHSELMTLHEMSEKS